MRSSVLDHKFGKHPVSDKLADALHTLPVEWARDHRPSASTRLMGGPIGTRVVVSPGSVQLQWSHAPGWQRAGSDEVDRLLLELQHVRRQLDKLDVRLYLETAEGPWFGEWDYFAERDELLQRMTDVRDRLGLLSHRGRSRIGEWSRKSRSRMTRRLATLDWSPMAPTETRVAAMVTLTYPGDYLAVARTGEVAKAHLKAFRSWWERRQGPASCVWKLERQRRGAPHFHLFLMVPHAHDRELVELRAAARRAWARIVDATREPYYGPWTDQHRDYAEDELRKHRAAGVSIDLSEGARYSDPQRIAVYFSKHNSAAVDSPKAYQNEAPDGWVDPEDGGGVGRWWGYWRLEPMEMEAELHLDDALEVRRILRGWVKAQRRVARRRVQRVERVRGRTVNPKTGEIIVGKVRQRAVTRRWEVRSLSHTRPAGFVLSNDAPALMQQIGRAVAVPADWPPGQRRPLP